MKLAEQVAIVTGASRGIGRATALALAAEGATVYAAARSAKPLETLAAEAVQRELTGRIVPAQTDVAKKQEIEALVERTVAETERLDILVNNAGITRDTLMMSMADEQFDEVIAVNLRAIFIATRAASKYMVRARHGRIVNIASVSGIAGNAGQSNYAASKAGVIGFSKSVAKELARRNITVNVVAPGFVISDMTDVLPDKLKESVKDIIPARRFGKTEEIAAAVVFLASPGAEYINGHVLVVDGGLAM
jgi:3-oxoacyl-[acyl-carrier protein] reductase